MSLRRPSIKGVLAKSGERSAERPDLVRFALYTSLPALLILSLAGCHTDMWRQPKQAPLDSSEFYSDGQSSRPLVPGTIPRGHLQLDDAYYTGFSNGKLVDTIPIKVDMALLKRGEERFNIYCTPCHGRLGNGDGMIAHRGFSLRRPPGNYHTDRLRQMPVGHFYDVIRNGYGAMYSYASRVEPQDRWAIVAYIRVLQLSEYAPPTDAAPADQQRLHAELLNKDTRLAQK